jgi:hypothetical protein
MAATTAKSGTDSGEYGLVPKEFHAPGAEARDEWQELKPLIHGDNICEVARQHLVQILESGTSRINIYALTVVGSGAAVDSLRAYVCFLCQLIIAPYAIGHYIFSSGKSACDNGSDPLLRVVAVGLFVYTSLLSLGTYKDENNGDTVTVTLTQVRRKGLMFPTYLGDPTYFETSTLIHIDNLVAFLQILGTLGVIFVCRSPFEVLMNSIAVSFITRLDDDLVTLADTRRVIARLKGFQPGTYTVDYKNRTSIITRICMSPVIILGALTALPLARIILLLLGPPYLAICM